MSGEPRIFTGTVNKRLADQVAKKMYLRLDDTEITKFSDGEIRVELTHHVRGSKAFIIQSMSSPVNDSLMEVMLLADALRRSSVQEIIGVFPYFAYSRQDRRPGYSRVPISARVIADMLEGVGINRVLLVDIHATQIQGFFHVPTDNISATQLFVADIYRNHTLNECIMVSPDVGGVARARSLAKHLNNTELAIVDKRRPNANVSEVMNIIGDVKDKTCIIVDDMVDTAGTMCKAADALIEVGGAKAVVAYATHGVLSGKALENIQNSKLTELVITDTIPLAEQFKGCKKVRQLTISGILAEIMLRINSNKSISELLE